MISTKTDEEVKVTQNEGKAQKEHKHKTQKFTVDELLQNSEKVELYDEYGKKKKIKVKIKHGKLKKREARMGYMFVMPYIIGIIAFFLYPLIMSFVYSLCESTYSGYTQILTFIGTDNYSRVFEKYTEITFDLGGLALKLLIAVPLIVVFSLLMAMMLNMKLKGKGIFRTIYFLPVIVVSGPVMSMINSQTASIGNINLSTIEETLSTVIPMWMATSVSWAFSNILLFLWYSGVQILIFLAALQKVDTSLYEAAKIDGGSGWECFWKITLPTIKPMLLLNGLYTVVFLSQDTLISGIIQKIANEVSNPSEGHGYTSAMAWLYSLVILVFVAVVALAFKQKKDIYAKQVKKTKKLEKKTKRKLAKHQKQLIRNEIKLKKALEKENKLKASGKDLKGGNFDE